MSRADARLPVRASATDAMVTWRCSTPASCSVARSAATCTQECKGGGGGGGLGSGAGGMGAPEGWAARRRATRAPPKALPPEHKHILYKSLTLNMTALTSRAVRCCARSDMSRCCSGSKCSSAPPPPPPCGVQGVPAGLGVRLSQLPRLPPRDSGVPLGWGGASWPKGVPGPAMGPQEWAAGNATTDAEDVAESWLARCISSQSPAITREAREGRRGE